MTYFGIILTFLLGFVILYRISSRFRAIEFLGLAFLTGIFSQTLLMFTLNILGIDHNLALLLAISIFLLVGIGIWDFLGLLTNQSTVETTSIIIGKWKPKSFNFLWLFASGLIVYILFLISSKSLYWPTSASDSLTSFDLYAKALAHEGRLLNSLIYEKRVGYGAGYPPLYSMSLSYAHLLGFESSKIIPVMVFLSFVLSFYSLLAKLANATNAALFTLFMIATPELLAQSAINTTSVTHAVYSSLGVLSLVVWRKHKEWQYFYLSALLLGASGFTRSEGILYMVPLIVLVFFDLRKGGNWRPFFFYLSISGIPFLAWQFFLKAHSGLMEKFVQVRLILTPNIDWPHIEYLLDMAYNTITVQNYYGITLGLFMVLACLNVIRIYKNKDRWELIVTIFFVYFGYILLLNQFELKSDSFEAIMRNSGKRFFFGVVILMWGYIASNSLIVGLFDKIEKLINLQIFRPDPSK